jgi:hypothetical protein
MKRFLSMGFCILLAISFCSTAAAAIESAQNQSRHVYAPNKSIEADVRDEHVHDESSEAGLLGTEHEAHVRKMGSIANGGDHSAQVSHEEDTPRAFTNKVATERSLQEGRESCTFIVTILNETAENSVCDLVRSEDGGDGFVSGETVNKNGCARGRCRRRRSLVGPGEFNYPGIGHMVVTATGIANCTSFEQQLKSTPGVTYVERDVLGCLVNENSKEQVSEISILHYIFTA